MKGITSLCWNRDISLAGQKLEHYSCRVGSVWHTDIVIKLKITKMFTIAGYLIALFC